MAHVARSLTSEEKKERNIHGLVYALCIVHCCRNAQIRRSNIRSLCVQWAKCGSVEDQERKVKQLQRAGITKAEWSYMQQNWKQVTYLGLKKDQNLETNYEVVSNNVAEENNARIKKIGERSMAPVDHTHHFLTDMATTFTTRYTKAKSYENVLQEKVCPAVMKNTLQGAEFMHQQKWSVVVTDAHVTTGLAGSATSVTYTVSKNCGISLQCYPVTLRFDPSKPWYENIQCPCNRTLAYGRPCYHASLCLVYPSVTDANAFVTDATKFSYRLRCWYSPVFYVSTMILQYSAAVHIPAILELIMYALFPPRLMLLAGIE